jgi:hypothetical protein
VGFCGLSIQHKTKLHGVVGFENTHHTRKAVIDLGAITLEGPWARGIFIKHLSGASGFLIKSVYKADTTWASEGFVDDSLGRGSFCLPDIAEWTKSVLANTLEGPGGFSKRYDDAYA